MIPAAVTSVEHRLMRVLRHFLSGCRGSLPQIQNLRQGWLPEETDISLSPE